MHKWILLSFLVFFSVSCQSLNSSDESSKTVIQMGKPEPMLVSGHLEVPLNFVCAGDKADLSVKINKKSVSLKCEHGKASYLHKVSKQEVQLKQKKRKDIYFTVTYFHPGVEAETRSRRLVVLSYKDLVGKLDVLQSHFTMSSTQGIFTSLQVSGQCLQDSKVTVELFNDVRGASLEEAELSCDDMGFFYVSERAKGFKKGTKLLIREIYGGKPMANQEIVLLTD